MTEVARTTYVLVLALAAAATAANADELIMVDGTTVTCDSIKDATTTKVTFKVGASNQERPADQVERIIPSGDQGLDTAMRLMRENGDAGRIESNLKRTIERGEAVLRPFAQYFLGEFYHRAGKLPEAMAAYEAVATMKADHFYAPVGIYKTAEILLGQNQPAPAQQRLARLASGDFGPAWKDKGGYMQARLQLQAGQSGPARASFAKLASGAATPAVRHLASCGEATCDLLSNQADTARRKFTAVLSARDASGEARGWAQKGLGDCLKASSPDEALLFYLRSFLLYPSNPEARAAATAAGEVAAKQSIEGAQRLTALGRGPMTWGDFTGTTQVDSEVMRRTMQYVSAALVRRLAPALAAKATGDEKPELEFLAADALKVVAQSTNDAALLKEYGDTLKALQAKYPNHGRAALAGIDGFQAAKDRALVLIAASKEESDPTKSAELLAQGRKLFADNMEPFKATIAELTKQVDAYTEKEAAGELSEAETEAKQESEFRRDLAEFLLAEAYGSYATTFAEGDAGRADNLKKALEGYEHQINNRGQFQRLLNFAYVGRVDTQIELGQLDEAIRNARELTDIEPPYIPEDPAQRKAMLDDAKDVCIRAFCSLIKALVKAGKFAEAVEAADGIDDKPTAKGWQDHPMGILLTFERAKALGGAGRGAQGAEELWSVIEKAMSAPEADKIPGLGMSRLGAGACRALSELSDVSGGEIYPPAIQYHVGIGYFLRQRPELAIAGFKGVLVAARTPQERREWVPKAVRQIGNLYFEQSRFLEAALAYETVMTEFPDHESGGEAIRFSLSAAKRAIEQFGEDPTNTNTPLVKLYKRIEGGAAKNDPEQAAKIFMNEAADKQNREQWVPAAEAYLQVPAEIKGEASAPARKVSFYPNAVANAGYCYFQAFKKGKNPEHLSKARESLARSVQLAREANDLEAQSLGAFYLGELECDMDRPAEALAALAPFDAELRATTRYIVRARYQQAQAHFMLNQPDALEKAEAEFRKVADKRDDVVLARFAYFMSRSIRSRANEVLKAPGDQLDAARELRRRAARYAKDFFDSTPKESLREAHYFWIGGVLFDGGMYAECAAVYGEALQKFQRPAADGSEAATDAQGSFDRAELQRGFSLVLAGQHRPGLDALKVLQDSVDVRDRDNRLVGRGRFKERRQEGPFNMTFQGRKVSRKVWFTVVEVGGADVKYFDTTDNPPQGGSEFKGVPGNDPTKSWGPAEERTLTLPLRRDYLVVDGMARASWALWEATQDKNFLANDVSAAINELRYVLRGMSENYYRQLVGSSQLEPTDYNLRVWDADVQYLRLKMARELWREVASDIKQMDMLGKLATAPAEVRTQLDAIRAEAEGKQ